MKKYLLLILAAFFLSQAAFAGTPKISVKESHWEFGAIPQDAKVHHEYWIKNVGDDTLRIVSVKPG